MKSFSENIDGGNLYKHPGTEYLDNVNTADNFAPEDVTVEMIRRGTSLKAKMELYFQYAGITNPKHKQFIKNKVADEWVDWKYLDPGGFQGDYYNTELLEQLQGWDREATYTGEKGVGTHMPTAKLEKIEKELEEMIKEKVPGMTLQDRKRIWKTKGHVPPWWDPVPTTKSLTYYMKKIIQEKGTSAADIENAIKVASTGKLSKDDNLLTDQEKEQKRMILLGFPAYESERILEGKRGYDKRIMKRIKTFGEFYHRDVGWY